MTVIGIANGDTQCAYMAPLIPVYSRVLYRCGRFLDPAAAALCVRLRGRTYRRGASLNNLRQTTLLASVRTTASVRTDLAATLVAASLSKSAADPCVVVLAACRSALDLSALTVELIWGR